MNDEANVNRENQFHFTNGLPPGRGRSRGRVTNQTGGNGHDPEAPATGAAKFGPADFLPFVDALGRRWKWLMLGGAAMAVLGLLGGLALWQNSYTASAQLLRQSSAQVMEVLGDREMEPNTYASLLRAPQLLQRVAAKARPPLTTEFLSKHLNITPERNSDVLLVAVSTPGLQDSVDLANLYAREAVQFSQEMQTNAAVRVNLFVTGQLAPVEAEINALNPPPTAGTNNPRSIVATIPLVATLQAARLELTEMQSRYQDRHPMVREQQAKIAAIERQLQPLAASTATPGEIVDTASPGLLGSAVDPILTQAKLQSLENARLTLIGQKQAALWLETHPPGTCELLAPATLKEVIKHGRKTKIGVLAAFSALFGLLLAGGLILLVEATDPRLKTVADVQRVTRLRVVASAGDLEDMTVAEQRNWAFRSLTSLQNLLSPSANQGFICGITSAEHGEGRSTWIRLMAEAASQRGFRVLTVVARPPDHNGTNGENGTNGHLLAKAEPVAKEFSELEPESGPNGQMALVASHVLSTPDEVTQKLMGPNPEPVVEIPLPGWVWNLERRKQWQAALRQWNQIDNIALLVELPPASLPETVLLAENLPNLIWLADAEKATAAKTIEQLQTLRNARCHLAGAVLNHAPVSTLKNRFARWLSCMALIMGVSGFTASGQESVLTSTNVPAPAIAPVVANTNRSLSVVSPAQRAAWQRRLTLGPGDVLTMGLWGEPLMTRTEVAIGPDGRISFAEAQDVMASGLTVDELRTKLNEELGQHRRAPEVMLTPVAFRSKKYYVLGRVMTKGVYILDRPITVLEAVSRAHGFETGLVERNIITVADFSRSFLMRKGKRHPLNFENLFLNGDLTQNLSIEPGDYLYFPGANVKEVYILGEVRLPGPTACTPNLTVMGAIASRAGWTDDAYKGHVLVVRGSLDKPETFVLDTKAILAGKTPDFRLQPKDIVFVNSRPFIYAEELLDRAITAFLQSLVAAEVFNKVVKPYQE